MMLLLTIRVHEGQDPYFMYRVEGIVPFRS